MPMYNDEEFREEMGLNPPPLIIDSMPNLERIYCNLVANKKLFGNLIYDKEVTFLFGSSNAGKSLLAYAIAEKISGGHDFMPQLATEKFVSVLYIDCELSMMHLKKRYGGYKFNENFHRAELNYEYRGSVIDAISKTMEKEKYEFLIIDNLTYLQNDNETGSAAIELMHRLIEIKKKYDCGLLVINHMPKRNPKEPISQDSMSGSKNLSNLCDAMFAIGQSYKRDWEFLRYIKQVKCRSDAKPEDDKIVLVQVMDTEPFLRHTFYGVGFERDHLQADGRRANTEQDIEQIQEIIAKMMQAGEKPTDRVLAQKTGFSLGKVNKLKNNIDTTQNKGYTGGLYPS